ncbi:glutaredoxin family protein [Massilia sp. erpn]|uniref:glutaredoxin family protein n=1 Tax=Massilia sp. erpn TaxID=2738142 RepID=UPI002104F597|nr:glutaredoxin family protein [Massilia sp. erpn]UTY58149.1 glutaredoxin family protein [Massilia sp. erpn]
MRAALTLLLLLAAGTAGAQMYKWKDAKGVTHYSDTPPPASAKQAEIKNFNSAPGADLPALLAEVARSHPVVLYTAADCAACAEGRALLQARGIPYSEKTVSTVEDHAVLKKAGSAGQLPLLLVGQNKQIGFETATWDGLLNSAGYPANSALPPGYRNPPASSAAPRRPSAAERERQAQEAARAAAEEEARSKRPPPPANAPPDFQF